MRQSIDIDLWQRTRYNSYKEAYPDGLNQRLYSYILHMSGAFYESYFHPFTSVVVDLLPVDMRDDMPESIQVYTFGQFRKTYVAVKQAALILTPVYLSWGILPVVRPVLRREWLSEVRTEGPVFNAVTSRGIMIFSVVADFKDSE